MDQFHSISTLLQNQLSTAQHNRANSDLGGYYQPSSHSILKNFKLSNAMSVESTGTVPSS
jgi:hypothetical protein